MVRMVAMLLLGFLLARSPVRGAGPAEIDLAFTRLYNFDFPGAHAALDQRIATHPEDPLAYSVRASAYLFYELDRLSILEGEFFADDRRIADKKKIKPDPDIRVK